MSNATDTNFERHHVVPPSSRSRRVPLDDFLADGATQQFPEWLVTLSAVPKTSPRHSPRHAKHSRGAIPRTSSASVTAALCAIAGVGATMIMAWLINHGTSAVFTTHYHFSFTDLSGRLNNLANLRQTGNIDVPFAFQSFTYPPRGHPLLLPDHLVAGRAPDVALDVGGSVRAGRFDRCGAALPLPASLLVDRQPLVMVGGRRGSAHSPDL